MKKLFFPLVALFLITLLGCNSGTSPSADENALVSIAITPSSAVIGLSEPQQFTATATYEDETTADVTSEVTWASSNTDAATLSEAGLASSVAVGTSNITATLDTITSDAVSLEVKQMYAYISNFNNNTVSICPVSADSSLGACTASTGTDTFSQPLSIAFVADGSWAYITNFDNSTVSICPVESDGTFGACSTSTGSATFIGSDGAVINAANTHLYITNYTFATTSICPINTTDGSIGDCTTTTGDGTFDQPQCIGLHGDFAYIANLTDTVSICSVSSADASLSDCTTSTGDGTFLTPEGISFHPDGTFMYVGNQETSLISICPLNADGSLGTCTTSSGNDTFDFSVFTLAASFTSGSNGYGYVPNSGNDTVSVCPVNADGTLGTCTVASDDTFDQPSVVVLNFLQ